MSVERRAINARRIDEPTCQFAKEHLQKQWSLEQISGHVAINPKVVCQRRWADKHMGGSLGKKLCCRKLRKKRDGKTPRAVGQAITELLKPHRKRVSAISSDDGREFAGHEDVSKQLPARIAAF